MWDAFGTLTDLLRIDNISIDNHIFKLHYKFTTFILVVFSASITIKQQFGDPIDCLPDHGEGKKSDDFVKAIDAYCWVSATYTVVELQNGKIGKDVIAPGVGQLDLRNSTKLHNYYQWVGLFLFIQAIMFYTPHFLWMIMDNGKIRMLSKDLMSSALDEDTQATQRKNLKFYFMGHLGHNNLYFFRFVFCEILNFVNIIGQILLTDVFLKNEFATYGRDILKFDKKAGIVHPMDWVFPKVTKCQFNNYGPGGNIIPHDIICIMPLNRINENVYLFLWFWFGFVAIISTLHLIYRVCVILFEPLRALLLSRRAVWTMIERERLNYIVSRLQLGDWFILYQLGKNIDKVAFNEFIKDVANAFEDVDDLIEIKYKQSYLESNMNLPRCSIASAKEFPQERKLSDVLHNHNNYYK